MAEEERRRHSTVNHPVVYAIAILCNTGFVRDTDNASQTRPKNESQIDQCDCFVIAFVYQHEE